VDVLLIGLPRMQISVAAGRKTAICTVAAAHRVFEIAKRDLGEFGLLVRLLLLVVLLLSLMMMVGMRVRHLDLVVYFMRCFQLTFIWVWSEKENE
jgi:hypothetical protein